MEERLQKLLSAAGVCSRRRAEDYIEAGRVTVNGRVAGLGDKADLSRDTVALDGVELGPVPEPVYLMLNKPRGFVSTLSDEQGRRTAAGLVAGCGVRVWPVGRLDLDSEGLLLFTNDGALTHKLLHPSHEVEKEYHVRVEGDVATGQRGVMPGLFYRLPEPRPGLSPLLERELDFRSNGESRTEPLERKLSRLREILGREGGPYLLLREGKPADFSCLPILQYGPEVELRRCESFSQLLDVFYAGRATAEKVGQRGAGLLKAVTRVRDRVARRVDQQELEREATRDRERKRELGDILTSSLHVLEKGMRTVRLTDYYDPEGREVEIPLDPLLTPQQNAARYYKEYNKAKTAEVVLGEQIEKGRRELEYLDSVLEAVHLAEGERDLLEIRQELTETGYLRRGDKAAKRMKAAAKPMEFRSSAGLRISVGKNNTQNDLLTTRLAGKGDLWLHTQKIHGSHVILWTGGETPDAKSVEEAAVLAAWFSQAREGKKVPVDYTPVKYVKKPAGARPGMVVYTTYQTAYVDPDGDLAKKLRVK